MVPLPFLQSVCIFLFNPLFLHVFYTTFQYICEMLLRYVGLELAAAGNSVCSGEMSRSVPL
jgi:hypothetical protein